MTDSRFVTITSAQPPLTVTAIIGETPPVPAGGYGGWNLVDRPRRRSLTEWGGIEPLRVLVPLILGVKPGPRGSVTDAVILDTPITRDRETLERMSQPPAPGAEPPLLTVRGSVPHSSAGPWVVESFDWDASPLLSAKGFLVRQAVTVHLLQYVRDDRVNDVTAAQAARTAAATKASTDAKAAGGNSNQPTKQKLYIVRAGDTLQGIAARLLGNYKRWSDIATLNSIRDPKSIVPGQQLRMP